MFLSADENAAVQKTVELVQRLGLEMFTESKIRQCIKDARQSPGVMISTGGLSFIHHNGDYYNDDWAETKVFLNIADFLVYDDRGEQQFVYQQTEENHPSVPIDWI